MVGPDDMLMGGMTGGADDLYREVILDHFKSPRNHGRVASPTTSGEGVNPMCGDEIEVTLLLENGRVRDIKFSGHGCAISQASASMMTEIVKGKSVDDTRRISVRCRSRSTLIAMGRVSTLRRIVRWSAIWSSNPCHACGTCSIAAG